MSISELFRCRFVFCLLLYGNEMKSLLINQYGMTSTTAVVLAHTCRRVVLQHQTWKVRKKGLQASNHILDLVCRTI